MNARTRREIMQRRRDKRAAIAAQFPVAAVSAAPSKPPMGSSTPEGSHASSTPHASPAIAQANR